VCLWPEVELKEVVSVSHVAQGNAKRFFVDFVIPVPAKSLDGSFVPRVSEVFDSEGLEELRDSDAENPPKGNQSECVVFLFRMILVITSAAQCE
jgi:hypothetical protein